MLTELQPHQQAVAIITRLGGIAGETARLLHPHEIANGGVLNGQQLDPDNYLISNLATRFAPLEEESRLKAITEHLAFQRLPGESIDQLLLRCEIVRQRSATEGQLTI